MATLLEQLKDRTIDKDKYYTITVNNGHEEKKLDVKILKFNDTYNNVEVQCIGYLPREQRLNTAFPIVNITDIQEKGDPILKGGRRRRKSCKRSKRSCKRRRRKSYRKH